MKMMDTINYEIVVVKESKATSKTFNKNKNECEFWRRMCLGMGVRGGWGIVFAEGTFCTDSAHAFECGCWHAFGKVTNWVMRGNRGRRHD